jgi:hypothetical protein
VYVQAELHRSVLAHVDFGDIDTPEGHTHEARLA